MQEARHRNKKGRQDIGIEMSGLRCKAYHQNKDIIMSISIKVHEGSGRLVVSLCDFSLLGKKFEEKNFELDIRKRFYEGETMPEAEMIKIIKEATDINAVGNESISFLIRSRFISQSQVKKIANIPIITIFAI